MAFHKLKQITYQIANYNVLKFDFRVKFGINDGGEGQDVSTRYNRQGKCCFQRIIKLID